MNAVARARAVGRGWRIRSGYAAGKDAMSPEETRSDPLGMNGDRRHRPARRARADVHRGSDAESTVRSVDGCRGTAGQRADDWWPRSAPSRWELQHSKQLRWAEATTS